MLKCGCYLTHRCPFVIREVVDTRPPGQVVHLFAIGEHVHLEQLYRGPGLNLDQRAALEPYLAGGGLRPMHAMRILAVANGRRVDTNGRSNADFRRSILGPFLQRRRNQEARLVGDSYGEILEFARTHSLFAPHTHADIHRIEVIFARVGVHVIHGPMTSTSRRAARPVGNNGRRGRNNNEERTSFCLALSSVHLLGLFGAGTRAWNQLGEHVCFYQDDVINNVNWEQYPMHLGGTSDFNQKFHSITVSVISDETEVPSIFFRTCKVAC